MFVGTWAFPFCTDLPERYDVASLVYHSKQMSKNCENWRNSPFSFQNYCLSCSFVGYVIDGLSDCLRVAVFVLLAAEFAG